MWPYLHQEWRQAGFIGIVRISLTIREQRMSMASVLIWALLLWLLLPSELCTVLRLLLSM